MASHFDNAFSVILDMLTTKYLIGSHERKGAWLTMRCDEFVRDHHSQDVVTRGTRVENALE